MKQEIKKQDTLWLKILGCVVGIGFILFLIGSFIVLLISIDITGSAKCSIENINLVDVTPDKCWDDDFSAKHCPIPQNINCEFSGSLPMVMLK